MMAQLLLVTCGHLVVVGLPNFLCVVSALATAEVSPGR